MSSGKGTPMTPDAASRIQSAEAKSHGGKVEAGSFAARAQVSRLVGGLAVVADELHPIISPDSRAR